MKHERAMDYAVTLTKAFIQNGDLRHDRDFQPGGKMQHMLTDLLIQTYLAVQQADANCRPQAVQSMDTSLNQQH